MNVKFSLYSKRIHYRNSLQSHLYYPHSQLYLMRKIGTGTIESTTSPSLFLPKHFVTDSPDPLPLEDPAKFKIIQASGGRTGSTLLVNLIHGYLLPDEKVQFDSIEGKQHIHTASILKTHNINIEAWEKTYPQYKLFFIMSERNDDKVSTKIPAKYRKNPNVLIINYNKLLVNDNYSQKRMINYIFNKFNKFIPKNLKPNKDDALIIKDMEKRYNIVNETVERLKDKEFTFWDKFTHIHGSHRNRNKKTEAEKAAKKSNREARLKATHEKIDASYKQPAVKANGKAYRHESGMEEN